MIFDHINYLCTAIPEHFPNIFIFSFLLFSPFIFNLQSENIECMNDFDYKIYLLYSSLRFFWNPFLFLSFFPFVFKFQRENVYYLSEFSPFKLFNV